MCKKARGGTSTTRDNRWSDAVKARGFASNEADGEAQEQALRATFPGIRDSVRELLGKRMDALARKFHDTHDMKVKDEIERLAKEYGKLKKPWVFRP